MSIWKVNESWVWKKSINYQDYSSPVWDQSISSVSLQSPSQHIFSHCWLTTKHWMDNIKPFSYAWKPLLPSHHILFALVHYLMGNMEKSGRLCRQALPVEPLGRWLICWQVKNGTFIHHFLLLVFFFPLLPYFSWEENTRIV